MPFAADEFFSCRIAARVTLLSRSVCRQYASILCTLVMSFKVREIKVTAALVIDFT